MRVSEIVLRLNDPDQLLIETGSLFYGRRMLTADADQIIIDEASLSPPKDEIRLKIQFCKKEVSRVDEIVNAVHKHFSYRRNKAEKQLKSVLQLGRRSLLMSLAIFGLLIWLINLIVHLLPEGRLSVTFQEPLIILGWVALWRPADLLLYEWRPIKREVMMFRQLERCKVEIETAQ